jgi:LemA protein
MKEVIPEKEVKMRKKGIIVGGVVGGIILIVILTTVSYYNNFVSLNETIEGAWAQVENQLKRRNDLIPNLVSSVKGYMKHEKEIFHHIAEARTRIAKAKTIPEKIKAYEGLGGVLGRLLLIVERYPNLKANESFNRLMDELAGTENRISVERRRYNEKVRQYNTIIKRFPGVIFAKMFNQEEKIYFEVKEEEKEVPKVEF